MTAPTQRLVPARWRCAAGCRLRAACAPAVRRRRCSAAARCRAAGAGAGDGADVGKEAGFTKLVPARAGRAGRGAAVPRRCCSRRRSKQRARRPTDHPQVLRLRSIAQRIIPFTAEWNPRAESGSWEVNLIGSKQLNAFCMPGGKIAFYYGILAQAAARRRRGGRRSWATRWRTRCASTRASAWARPSPRAARIEIGCGAARPGQRRAARWPTWAASC